jgi:hypothetical protein
MRQYTAFLTHKKNRDTGKYPDASTLKQTL